MLDLWDFEWTIHVKPAKFHLAESLKSKDLMTSIVVDFYLESDSKVNGKVSFYKFEWGKGGKTELLKNFEIQSNNSLQIARQINYIVQRVEEYFDVNFTTRHNLHQIAPLHNFLLEDIIQALEENASQVKIKREIDVILSTLKASKYYTPSRIYGLRTVEDMVNLMISKAPFTSALICKACRNINVYKKTSTEIVERVLEEEKNQCYSTSQ